MTPLEKALSEKGKVNYCDECELFQIVGNAAYCKVDGKLILPIMLARSQGTGPAWNCKKRNKTSAHYDRIISKTPEELADWIAKILDHCENKKPEELCRMSCPLYKCCNDQPYDNIEDWLKSPVEVDT